MYMGPDQSSNEPFWKRLVAPIARFFSEEIHDVDAENLSIDGLKKYEGKTIRLEGILEYKGEADDPDIWFIPVGTIFVPLFDNDEAYEFIIHSRGREVCRIPVFSDDDDLPQGGLVWITGTVERLETGGICLTDVET